MTGRKIKSETTPRSLTAFGALRGEGAQGEFPKPLAHQLAFEAQTHKLTQAVPGLTY